MGRATLSPMPTLKYKKCPLVTWHRLKNVMISSKKENIYILDVKVKPYKLYTLLTYYFISSKIIKEKKITISSYHFIYLPFFTFSFSNFFPWQTSSFLLLITKEQSSLILYFLYYYNIFI